MLFAVAAEAAGPTWEALVETSRDRMAEAQEALISEHGLVEYEQYYLHTVARGRLQLEFSNAGVVGVKARATYIGSFDPTSKVWLWGWADDSLPAGLNTAVKKVRRHGQRHGFERLVQPSFVVEEHEVAGLVAVAYHLLDGKGFYLAPGGGIWNYVVLDDVRPVPR
jgi:hypothetical protein